MEEIYSSIDPEWFRWLVRQTVRILVSDYDSNKYDKTVVETALLLEVYYM